MARPIVKDDEYLIKTALARGCRSGRKSRLVAEAALRVGKELGKHLFGRKDEVDEARGDDASRHSVVLGRFGGLSKDYAPFALDRPYA